MAKFKNKIKLNIESLRKVTQSEMANAIGTNKANISRWENGEVEPDLETLIKLAKYFNVSVDYLLGVETQKQEVVPEFNQEQLQVVELIKKLNSKELEKVYNYLLGIIDARD